MLLLPCPECCDERPFEQPVYADGSCEDGHGLDCPEWLCSDCGYGMWIASYPEIERPLIAVAAFVDNRRAA